MKKTTVSGLFSLFLVAIILSCSDEPSPINPVVKSNNDSANHLSIKDTISNKKFQNWKQNWATNGTSFLPSNGGIEYFDMPLIDLKELLLEVEGLGYNKKNMPDNARFYMGLRMDTIPNQAHLILVGIDKNGNNLLNNSLGQFAYDLSKPCPKYCNPPRHN